MTKRGVSKITARIAKPDRDLVDTPPEPVRALVTAFRPAGTLVTFSEPCAGAGRLLQALEAHGHRCGEAWDINPRAEGIEDGDACTRVPRHLAISNPPYSQAKALPILEAAVTWPKGSIWLVPLDWLANKWCAPFLPHVAQVVPVGRVSWVRKPDGSPTGSGFENSAWIVLRPTPARLIVPRR